MPTKYSPLSKYSNHTSNLVQITSEYSKWSIKQSLMNPLTEILSKYCLKSSQKAIMSSSFSLKSLLLLLPITSKKNNMIWPKKCLTTRWIAFKILLSLKSCNTILSTEDMGFCLLKWRIKKQKKCSNKVSLL